MSPLIKLALGALAYRSLTREKESSRRSSPHGGVFPAG